MMAKSWRYLVIGAVAVAVLTVAPWATNGSRRAADRAVLHQL